MSDRRPIESLLVANRGEIAVRVMRTAKALGIRTIAVYSDADADAPHVRAADLAARLGPPEVRKSYLDVDAILDAARRTGADAIHPGYGFLSENAEFAARVVEAGLRFVGPPAEAIRLMGDKVIAKQRMIEAGVPTAPGFHGDTQDIEALRREAEAIGYPLLVKASAGGGGRGMRIVRADGELLEAVQGARSEAANAFGRGDVFLEKLIEGGRHIEIQVFCDTQGSAIHLGERECSVQRRHQKIIEEAPSPAVSEELRARMGAAAV
ncbi:MAG: ATP-grasp domain-containing protein, partial [Deltaproteobacteria bacterium]|nr:ATP-grasp domain-containing protein [Nannocystaceae bacterium]